MVGRTYLSVGTPVTRFSPAFAPYTFHSSLNTGRQLLTPGARSGNPVMSAIPLRSRGIAKGGATLKTIKSVRLVKVQLNTAFPIGALKLLT